MSDLETLIKEQHGHLSRDQAVALGFKSTRIAMCVQDGRWVRVHPSVYRVAWVEPSWLGALVAATLWARGRAVISHQAAARLHGFSDFERNLVELSGTAKLKGPDGVGYHEVRNLPPGDVTAKEGIPVTTVERTLHDLTTTADTPEGIIERYVERSFDEALRNKETTITRLKWCAESNEAKGRPTALFRELLEIREKYGVTDSPLESDFAYHVRKAGLIQPYRGWLIIHNYRLVAQVDFAWPAYRVLVQVHGGDIHRQKKTWENDQRVENALTSFGWTVLKVTDDLMKNARPWLIAQLGSLLLTPIRPSDEAPAPFP